MRRWVLLAAAALLVVVSTAAGARPVRTMGEVIWAQAELAADAGSPAPAFREWTHAAGGELVAGRWALPDGAARVAVTGECLVSSLAGSPYVRLEAGGEPAMVYPGPAGGWVRFRVEAAAAGPAREAQLVIGSSKEAGGVVTVRGLVVEAIP